MTKFGPVKYAVLCKAGQLKTDNEEDEKITTHKGTGFVQFKDPSIAD